VTPHLEFKLRRHLACVFQSPLLLDRTVFANVELGLKLRGVEKATRRKRVEKWLDVLGISSLAGQRATTLSGGEAQRVNIARALALKPEVMFMDEPLGGLDTPTRHVLLDEIGPLIREGAGAGMLVTHDRRTALAMGDRVAVMLNGEVRQIGRPEAVFHQPADVEVAKFVGVENILSAVSDGQSVMTENNVRLTSHCNIRGKGHLCLRAEEIHFGNEPLQNANWNALEGTVIKVLLRGDGFGVQLDVGCKIMGRLTRAQQAILKLEAGHKVNLWIRPEAVHFVKSV